MIEVQKAVITSGDKFLCLLRSKKSSFFPNRWDFPGGKLEPGEERIQGIIREVKEETNLDIIPNQVVGEFNIIEKNTKLKFMIYSAKSISGNIKIAHEHQEYKWLTKDEIFELKREPTIDFYFNQLYS